VRERGYLDTEATNFFSDTSLRVGFERSDLREAVCSERLTSEGRALARLPGCVTAQISVVMLLT
jgi:hypothetical protein